MLVIYYIVMVYNLGFFRLPDGSLKGIMDILNIVLFIYSVFKYINIRKNITYNFYSKFEIPFLLFLFYFVLSALFSDTNSKYGQIINLRLTYGFLLFFPTVILNDSIGKIKFLLRFCFFLAFLGSILSIVQSLHGAEPLFDAENYYNLGHWGGQQYNIFPGMARVMLPPIYTIYIVFIFFFMRLLVEKKKKNIVFMIVLILPIFISYARSFWLAIFITFSVILFIGNYYKFFKVLSWIKIFLITIVIIYVGIFIGQNFFGANLSYALLDRLNDLFFDVENTSGTLGSRIAMIPIALSIWAKNPFWGNGVLLSVLDYFPNLTDVGFVYVLVTIGLIGLFLIVLYYYSILYFGNKILRISIINNDKFLSLLALFTISIVILYIVVGYFTQYAYTMSHISLSTGVLIAYLRIVNTKIYYHN